MSECIDHDLPDTDGERLAEAKRRAKSIRAEEHGLYEMAKANLREGRPDDALDLLAEATVKATQADAIEEYACEQWGNQ